MLNVVYRLTRPRKFEVKFTECDASCANPVIRFPATFKEVI